MTLPTFTFRKSDESQGFGGFLGPGIKGVAHRNHEAASIPCPGRANRAGVPATVCDPGRGDHAKRVTVARWARLILRKPA